MDYILKDKFARVLFYVILALLAIFLAAQALLSFRQYQFTGIGVSASNTIVVTGQGKVTAKPDMASFMISVREYAKEQKEAQRKASEKINRIINYLKDSGIEEKDIKTSSFNLYPRYDWADGKRIFREYEASQSLTVKVKDLDRAGELLAAMSELGAENVGSLRFGIDEAEQEKLKAQARNIAISNAKAKAKELADSLGVELVRVVGFSESTSANRLPIMFAKARAAVSDLALDDEMPTPEIPTGENEIRANVSLTFEIR